MKARTKERLASIETGARALARSGQHVTFRSIQALLSEEGHPEVHKLFANPWTQAELNRICQQAQSAKMRAA